MLDQELLHGLLIGTKVTKCPLLQLSMVHMEQKNLFKKNITV